MSHSVALDGIEVTVMPKCTSQGSLQQQNRLNEYYKEMSDDGECTVFSSGVEMLMKDRHQLFKLYQKDVDSSSTHEVTAAVVTYTRPIGHQVSQNSMSTRNGVPLNESSHDAPQTASGGLIFKLFECLVTTTRLQESREKNFPEKGLGNGYRIFLQDICFLAL
ncbi:hypothetical protein H671_1g2165 [Cricetulus griseus]|uniref:Uncharacterized protein n=1 Tax=Cricetulus griseus TaxID=10029 RepID=A0A061IK47_CRIGR|nr:hypothetical protein H671_1g2165 [Cricetulus griseus]